MDSPAPASSPAPGSRIARALQDAAAGAGLRLLPLHQYRILPRHHRNRMLRQLHELGWTMDQIAELTHENAHRTTVARAIRVSTYRYRREQIARN